jgi:hypothetical protein
MTVQQQQSKQEQTTPASKTSTTTQSTSKSISKSKSVVIDHQSSATRAADGNSAKMISDKTNSNSNTESNKSPVDNFLTWLTPPLEIDVTSQTNNNNKTNDTITANRQSQQTKKPSNNRPQSQKQQHQKKVQPQTSSPKNNATKTVIHLPVGKQQQKEKAQTYHEQKMMQQNSTDKQQSNKDGTNSNKHDQNPAEQFLNWLTSPPDVGRSGQDPLSMTAHPNKLKKHATPSNPQPSNVNKPPQQQKQKSIQTHQSNTNRVVHHKNQPKQFGEKIVVSKPDLSRSKSIMLEINLDPHPELPSHVPTPDTIDDIDESWTNKVEGVIDNALGGIHHHFSNIFADNNQGKNNNNIKYAPSFDTPPQSPVSSGRKSIESKMLLTPPLSASTKTTKWGPEIWNAKKSSPTNSLTMMSPLSMSTTNLMSTAATTANNNSTNSIDHIFVDDELLNIELSELTNQEKLLRLAMERKQKREQKQKQNEATKNITATTATNVDGSGGDGSSSSSRHNNPSSSSSDVNKKKIKKKQPRDGISSSSGKKNTNEISNATQNKKTASSAAQSSPTSVTTPLQLRWMDENALNLQASCPRRGSLRRCDGEDLNCYSSSLYTPILTVDEKEYVCSSVMKEQQKHHQQQQQHNNVVIPKMSKPALESLNAIAV